MMAKLERRARPLLGTFVEIALRDGKPSIFAAAFEEIERLQTLMSAHSADSDLARIGGEAHRRLVTVDGATAEVIRFSLEIAQASAGAFDPVRAGVELVHRQRRPWFHSPLPKRHATWRDLEIVGRQVSASCPLALDLGGVAKGFAVDRAAEIISDHGGSGVVNAGGDLRFIGDEERLAWLKSPDVQGELCELRELSLPALATTGHYTFAENEDLIGGVSGESISAAISISVFAESCMLADAMTKVVMNLPPERAAVMLENYRCRALILESRGRFRELPESC